MPDRAGLAAASGLNEARSIDIVIEALSTGGRINCLAAIDDEVPHECLDVLVNQEILGGQVENKLDPNSRFRDMPVAIWPDRTSESACRTMDRQGYGGGINLKPVAAGKPIQHTDLTASVARSETSPRRWICSVIATTRASSAKSR